MTKPTITKPERDRLRALCEAASAAPWRVNAPDWPGGRKVGDDWTIGNLGADEREIAGKVMRSTIYVTTDCVRASEKGGGSAEDDAALIAAARNALPSLLSALDAAEARAERVERAEAERDAEGAQYEKVQRAYAQQLERAVTAESTAAALRAEVEGLRAKANAAHQLDGPNDSTIYRSYLGPVGSIWRVFTAEGRMIGPFDSLDAAWAAAEKAAEAAAKKEGGQ